MLMIKTQRLEALFVVIKSPNKCDFRIRENLKLGSKKKFISGGRERRVICGGEASSICFVNVARMSTL